MNLFLICIFSNMYSYVIIMFSSKCCFVSISQVLQYSFLSVLSTFHVSFYAPFVPRVLLIFEFMEFFKKITLSSIKDLYGGQRMWFVWTWTSTLVGPSFMTGVAWRRAGIQWQAGAWTEAARDASCRENTAAREWSTQKIGRTEKIWEIQTRFQTRTIRRKMVHCQKLGGKRNYDLIWSEG